MKRFRYNANPSPPSAGFFIFRAGLDLICENAYTRGSVREACAPNPESRMSNASDTSPAQIAVSGELRHGRTWFPAASLDLFIEHDLWFGNPKPTYSTSEDTQLTTDGAILRFVEQSGKQIWVAVIPIHGDDHCVDEWRSEIYRYKREAVAALAAGIANYDSSRGINAEENEECEFEEVA